MLATWQANGVREQKRYRRVSGFICSYVSASSRSNYKNKWAVKIVWGPHHHGARNRDPDSLH
jgi:hypothetical protein